MKKLTVLVALFIFLVSISADKVSCELDKNHETLNGILWMQTSAEYHACAEQTFAAARIQLDEALKDKSWTAAVEQKENYGSLPPAIIVDVDETVLSNMPFQAQLAKEGIGYNWSLWNEWVNKGDAEPISGAVEFLKYAAGKGVDVFYITNRNHRNETPTRQNLEKAGFPISDEKDFLLTKYEKEEWRSDKSNRRAHAAETHRILFIFGDNLNDFCSGAHAEPDARIRLVEKYDSYWGTKWFMLPNPLYGSWESSFYDSERRLKRFEQLERKYELLKGFK